MTDERIERLSAEESDMFKKTMNRARKQDPVREVLITGDVAFLDGLHNQSSRVQGLRYWANSIPKKLVTRTGERRGVSGVYVWLVDR